MEVASDDRASRQISRFRDKLLQMLVMVAVRIGEARRRCAELLFQLEPRLEKLAPGGRRRNQRQTRMGQSVRTDLDAILAKLSDLRPPHEGCLVPAIPPARAADFARDDKHRRGKAIARENRIGMLVKIIIAVVKSQDDGTMSCTPFAPTIHRIAQGQAKIPRSGKVTHLLFELLPRYRKASMAQRLLVNSDVVIAENR